MCGHAVTTSQKADLIRRKIRFLCSGYDEIDSRLGARFYGALERRRHAGTPMREKLPLAARNSRDYPRLIFIAGLYDLSVLSNGLGNIEGGQNGGYRDPQ
jgi:hypothetical protein